MCFAGSVLGHKRSLSASNRSEPRAKQGGGGALALEHRRVSAGRSAVNSGAARAPMQAMRGARARFAGPGGRFISAQGPLGASAAALAL
jgi:hypothetical protein